MVVAYFAGQVPKDQNFPDANEDMYELATDVGRIAVSDGASESFDSKTWAHILATRFAKSSELGADWLMEAIADYTNRYYPANLSWSKRAAYERGSFATLLGLELCIENSTVDLLSVGDSLAVLLDGTELIETFPYLRAAEFHQRPRLISTRNSLNSFITSPDFFVNHCRQWSLRGRMVPIVLCMTDAIAEWALRNSEEGHPVWEALTKINDLADLEDIVLRERQAKTMRIDDTTLVRMLFTKFGQDS